MMKSLIKKSASALLAFFVVFALPVAANAKTIAPSPVENHKSTAALQQQVKQELSQAVNAEQFGLGKGTGAKNKTSEVGIMSVGSPAAIITIFADSNGGSSGYVSGHAFITVKNVSGGTIYVGKLPNIANYDTVSVGTWGNKSEHTGLWYNLESWYVYHQGEWPIRKSVSYILTTSELATLNSYISYHDYWYTWSPCSSFAVGAWNAVVDASYSLSAGYPSTPQGLKNDIIATFPYTYQTGASVPFNYPVYYAQGTGAPLWSYKFN